MSQPRDLYEDAGERILATVRAIPDPAQRIRTVNELITQGGQFHGDLAQITREAAREMHGDLGMTYAEIGRALGVTKARAQQLAGRR